MHYAVALYKFVVVLPIAVIINKSLIFPEFPHTHLHPHERQAKYSCRFNHSSFYLRVHLQQPYRMKSRRPANTVKGCADNRRLVKRVAALEALLAKLEYIYQHRSVIAWEIPSERNRIPGLDVHPYI